ncbi:hypothetical protein BDQ17DRAFT_1544668 [Cyathus striatus]|nr:hypothetical protein BDQ17DRAFT_1544668 [Cyathus striatus]
MRSSRFFKSPFTTEDETPAAGNSDMISDTDFDADRRAHEDVFTNQPPARKKQKSRGSSSNVKETKAGRKVRRKRGVLKDFTEMPLDILFECTAKF